MVRRFVTWRGARVSKAAIMLSDRSVMAAARRSAAWKTGANVSWIQWVVGCVGNGWWLACWLSRIVIQEVQLFTVLSEGRTGGAKKSYSSSSSSVMGVVVIVVFVITVVVALLLSSMVGCSGVAPSSVKVLTASALLSKVSGEMKGTKKS